MSRAPVMPRRSCALPLRVDPIPRGPQASCASGVGKGQRIDARWMVQCELLRDHATYQYDDKMRSGCVECTSAMRRAHWTDRDPARGQGFAGRLPGTVESTAEAGAVSGVFAGVLARALAGGWIVEFAGEGLPALSALPGPLEPVEPAEPEAPVERGVLAEPAEPLVPSTPVAGLPTSSALSLPRHTNSNSAPF